jgi:hypothetical protein
VNNFLFGNTQVKIKIIPFIEGSPDGITPEKRFKEKYGINEE